MDLIKRIKKRLIESELKDLKKSLENLDTGTPEGLETGWRNLDGSTTFKKHPFRMPECMSMRENVVDRLWKDDVELFFTTIYDVLGDVLRKRLSRLSPGVRELYDAFSRLGDKETEDKMKRRWGVIRDLLCFFLETDLAYRWRFKYLLKDIAWSKLAYTPEDAYWLSKRIDVPPPEQEFSKKEIREWYMENYGEVPEEFV
jgi:hypothetical protein